MPSITKHLNTDSITSPYADTAIELSLLSVSTERYKTFYCIECRHPFLQRDNESYYRLNTSNQTATAYVSEGQILTRCGKCSQKYVVAVSLLPDIHVRYDIRITQVRQSIYLQAEAVKVERRITCMECGGRFIAITDRVSRVVDNCAPLQYMEASSIGQIQASCPYSKCKQRWALMV